METTESMIIFFYRLAWCFAISLVVSLLWAKQVATQATLVSDVTGRAQTTFKVDRGEFKRTWLLYTASLTGVSIVLLLLWETRQWMQDSGYIG